MRKSNINFIAFKNLEIQCFYYNCCSTWEEIETRASFPSQNNHTFVNLTLPQVFGEKKLHIEFPYLLQIKHDLYIKVRVYELTIINWFNCNKRWRKYTLNKWKRRPWFIILPPLTKELRLTHPVNVSNLWSSHNRYI